MRQKKHPEYYLIPAFQILIGKNDSEMAQELGIAKRTYNDKVKGWSDFSSLEGRRLSEIFNKPQQEIFLTKNVSKRNKVTKKG